MSEMVFDEDDARAWEKLGVKEEPGWYGAFTRGYYPGAMKNGSRVVKLSQDAEGDLTPLGTKGTVLGSIGHPAVGIFYFIEWDNAPRRAVGCMAAKVQAA